jgi:hypothetical protein
MHVITIMCNTPQVASGKPSGAMATPVRSFSMMYTHIRCSKFATPAISYSSVFVIDTSTSISFAAPIEAVVVGD